MGVFLVRISGFLLEMPFEALLARMVKHFSFLHVITLSLLAL